MDTIPVGMEYTVTATGATQKAVVCCRCRHEYIYPVRRTVKGDGFSPLFRNRAAAKTRARVAAEANLRQALQDAREAVSCPACGTYQPDMVPLLRARHRGWLRQAGLLAFAVGGIAIFGYSLFTTDFAPWWLWALTAVVPPGLFLTRTYLAGRYDPNRPADTERRRQLAQEKAARQAAGSGPKNRPAQELVPVGLGRDGTAGVVLLKGRRS